MGASSVLVLILRLLLAAVFAVAAVAKLADRPGAERAAAGLGVPARWAGAVAVALPLAEIAVAVLLLIPASAVAGAACAVLLLGLFTVVVARALQRGERPSCNCFGQLGAAPISGRTLARNGALLVAAAAALIGSLLAPSTDVLSALGELGGAGAALVVLGVVLVVVIALAARLALRLLRSYGRLLARVERLERALGTAGADPDDGAEPGGLVDGALAPAFDLEVVRSRERVALEELLAPGRHALLVFSDPGCGPCQALAPRLAGLSATAAEHLAVVALSATVPAEAPAVRTLFDEGRAVAEQYGAHATPAAVLVRPDGTLAGRPVAGAEAIEELVENYLNQRRTVERMLAGRLAADQTLLLFWSPSCGFCDAMVPKLQAWEREPDGIGPALAIVTGADPEQVRAQGLTSDIVHDPELILGDFYGAHGTPMGVLVGPDAGQRGYAGIGADEVMTMAAGEALSG